MFDHVGVAVSDLAASETVYHPGSFGTFVLDPDGHKVEVVNHSEG